MADGRRAPSGPPKSLAEAVMLSRSRQDLADAGPSSKPPSHHGSGSLYPSLLQYNSEPGNKFRSSLPQIGPETPLQQTNPWPSLPENNPRPSLPPGNPRPSLPEKNPNPKAYLPQNNSRPSLPQNNPKAHLPQNNPKAYLPQDKPRPSFPQSSHSPDQQGRSMQLSSGPTTRFIAREKDPKRSSNPNLFVHDSAAVLRDPMLRNGEQGQGRFGSSGIVNTAMIDVITEEKSEDIDPPPHSQPSRQQKGGKFKREKPSKGQAKSAERDTTPVFNLWICLSFFSVLAGFVGLAALHFVWKSRHLWETGQKTKGRRALRKGKILIGVSMLVLALAIGVVVWRTRVVMAAGKAEGEGGRRQEGGFPYYTLLEQQHRSDTYISMDELKHVNTMTG